MISHCTTSDIGEVVNLWPLLMLVTLGAIKLLHLLCFYVLLQSNSDAWLMPPPRGAAMLFLECNPFIIAPLKVR